MMISKKEGKRDTCWLMACVLDIRNFTELTARVDEVSRANYIEQARRISVLNGYREFVENTQKDAKEQLLEIAKKIQNRPWALKPTGDGLLFAIQLQDIEIEEGSPSDCGNYDIFPLKVAAVEDIKYIIEAIINIIKGSHTLKLECNGQPNVGLKTKDFITNHGSLLGYGPDDLRKFFFLAGACTMGIGNFTTTQDTVFGCKWLDDDQQRAIDANGHAVNLAFRLCSNAAKPLDGDSSVNTTFAPSPKMNRSPAILLQRELVHFVTSHDSGWEKAHNNGGDISFRHYRLQQELKGLECRWCYGIAIHNDGL
ncbi:MAG: hypothetical protein V5B44_13845 [Candidatus Accumulibacter necessarius]|jgi:hypothetical protein|uniref:hypothetical protein n=1 Tax=Candidatus Accumulibacter necessarius TaxID=2954386 RepID=UPI002FC2D1C1